MAPKPKEEILGAVRKTDPTNPWNVSTNWQGIFAKKESSEEFSSDEEEEEEEEVNYFLLAFQRKLSEFSTSNLLLSSQLKKQMEKLNTSAPKKIIFGGKNSPDFSTRKKKLSSPIFFGSSHKNSSKNSFHSTPIESTNSSTQEPKSFPAGSPQNVSENSMNLPLNPNFYPFYPQHMITPENSGNHMIPTPSYYPHPLLYAFMPVPGAPGGGYWVFPGTPHMNYVPNNVNDNVNVSENSSAPPQ